MDSHEETLCLIFRRYVDKNSRFGVETQWPVVTAAGGQYRLCWCAAGFRCSATEDFRVDMGEMQIVGPGVIPDPSGTPNHMGGLHMWENQDRTCVSGQTSARLAKNGSKVVGLEAEAVCLTLSGQGWSVSIGLGKNYKGKKEKL